MANGSVKFELAEDDAPIGETRKPNDDDDTFQLKQQVRKALATQLRRVDEESDLISI